MDACYWPWATKNLCTVFGAGMGQKPLVMLPQSKHFERFGGYWNRSSDY
jgi:hypothetical protein